MTLYYRPSPPLGPRSLLFYEIRRPPGPRAWGRTPRWKKRIRVTLAVIPPLIGCFFFWGILVEPNRLVLHQETVAIANWPRELDGLKIAVLSDIHAGAWGIDDKKLRLIVARTNQLQPDMIVILGDYMTGNGTFRQRVDPEVFAPVLKELRAPLGVYSVLGNHDWWWDGPRVRRGLEANGIKVLDDEVLEVSARGISIWLAGLAVLDATQRIDATIATAMPTRRIAIPQTQTFFHASQRVSLFGGNFSRRTIWFPVIGPIVDPSTHGYDRGHFFENNHHLFVTTGIGNSIIPIRFGVPPEIVLLTVRTQ